MSGQINSIAVMKTYQWYLPGNKVLMTSQNYFYILRGLGCSFYYRRGDYSPYLMLALCCLKKKSNEKTANINLIFHNSVDVAWHT